MDAIKEIQTLAIELSQLDLEDPNILKEQEKLIQQLQFTLLDHEMSNLERMYQDAD